MLHMLPRVTFASEAEAEDDAFIVLEWHSRVWWLNGEINFYTASLESDRATSWDNG